MSKLRQKRVLEKIVGNRGKTPGEAMREVGFSKAYSKNPKQMMSTKSWNELLEEELPDDELLKVHKGLLKDKNWKARDNGLDKAYKLKGKYAPEKTENVTSYESLLRRIRSTKNSENIK